MKDQSEQWRLFTLALLWLQTAGHIPDNVMTAYLASLRRSA